MSELQPLPTGGPSTADPGSESVPDASQFDAIVQAAFGDTARSSGSLESTASSSALSAEAPSSTSTSSASTSRSLPSLTTSFSTTASAASSKTPSPCPSILRANSAPPAAFPTLSGSLSGSGSASGSSSPNVTFAPLPQTEPRKRNSSHPLGVAARSRLLRHRRMLRERGLNPDDYPYQHQYGPGSGVEGGQGFPEDDGHPYADDDGAAVEFPDMVEGPEGAEAGRVRVRRVRTASDGRIMGDEEEEDPFVVLGRLVKDAGKTLWKSLSMRDMRAKERDAAKAAKEKDKDEAGADGQPRVRTSQGDGAAGGGQVRSGSVRRKEKKAGPRRHVVETGHLFDNEGATPPRASEDGGVWEEEVTEDSWKKLLSNRPPASDTADGDVSGDDQATPTPASVESVGSAPVPTTTTTIVVARPLTTKAR